MFPTLSVAVDEVLALDPDGLGDDELSAAILELERCKTRLEAAQLRLVGAWDARRVWSLDGARSGAAWLAHKAKTPISGMRALVRLARRLRSMPHTAAALGAGEIGLWSARLLADLNRPGLEADVAADEEMLVEHARTLSLLEFGRTVRYWEQLHGPDGVEDDARNDHQARRAHLSETMGGVRVLDATFDPVGGAAFHDVLRSIDQDLFAEDWALAKQQWGDQAAADKLWRTPAQRRLDSLVEMARRAATAPADGKQPRPLVTVLVDYPTLAGRLCQLSDGTVLTPGQVLPLLTDADIERVVFGPGARVIEVGRRTRLFTGALRRAIEVRDRFCTHPMCEEPADRGDIDHTIPYASGGETTQDNGNGACDKHNHDRQRGFTIQRLPDGTFIHRRPDGTEIS